MGSRLVHVRAISPFTLTSCVPRPPSPFFPLLGLPFFCFAFPSGKMGCLGNSKTEDQRNEEKAQREANKKIEKQLQKDKQIYRATHRLLLLGKWFYFLVAEQTLGKQWSCKNEPTKLLSRGWLSTIRQSVTVIFVMEATVVFTNTCLMRCDCFGYIVATSVIWLSLTQFFVDVNRLNMWFVCVGKWAGSPHYKRVSWRSPLH